MTLRTSLAALVLLGTAAPAIADTDPAARCRALLHVSETVHLTSASVTAVGRDGCDFAGLRMHISPRVGWSVDHLLVSRLDFAAVEAGHLPPALRLEAHGVRFAPTIGNPVAEYVMSVTMRPFDATLDYEGPTADGTLHLNELSMRGRSVGDMHLSAVVVGVDPAALDSADPSAAQAASLKSLQLHLDNQGFIEGYVVSTLAPMLLADAPDPAARVASLKATAILRLRVMLAATDTPAATVDALAAFVADMPHPNRVFDLTLDLPHPAGTAELSGLESGSVTARSLLPAGALTARYGTP